MVYITAKNEYICVIKAALINYSMMWIFYHSYSLLTSLIIHHKIYKMLFEGVHVYAVSFPIIQ